MNLTKIEWLRWPDGRPGLTWNPIKGRCPQACWYCYARTYYDRFKPLEKLGLGRDEIYLDSEELQEPFRRIKKKARIFVCSTMELFHPLVAAHVEPIFDIIRTSNFWHTFFILTKRPERARPYGPKPFSDNVWLGLTLDGEDPLRDSRMADDFYYTPALRKFISYEPLLGPPELLPIRARYVQWVIVGALSGPTRSGPSVDKVRRWVGCIMEASREAGIPVFVKDNLQTKYPIGPGNKPFVRWLPLVQEFPK